MYECNLVICWKAQPSKRKLLSELMGLQRVKVDSPLVYSGCVHVYH